MGYYRQPWGPLRLLERSHNRALLRLVARAPSALLRYTSRVTSLEALGFSPVFAAELELLEGDFAPARVVSEGRGVYALAGCQAPLGELAGRLRDALGPGQAPTTGDWVAIADDAERATIHHVLERRTALRRRAAGRQGTVQIVAANVDVFFVVTSANRDLSPRRIERYLAAIWDSGATPVIVVNKSDLATDLDAIRAELEPVARGVDIVVVSALAGHGLEELGLYFGPGKTIGFVGSSGVGKSSIINRLLGEELQPTREIRLDGKGRHATTRRQLVVLPEGGVLVDTPGMREFGLVEDEGGLDAAFDEIAELAGACRFEDCTHDAEPGCAVRAAVAAGELPEERFESYLRLQKEIRAAKARRDPILAKNTKRRWKSIHKSMRSFARQSRKRQG